jgi:hypothetical protein
MVHFCCVAQENVNKIGLYYYPNTDNFHLSYTRAYFYNVNGKPVSFSGLNFGLISQGNPKKGKTYSTIAFEYSADYYFPTTYNGELVLLATHDTTNPHVKTMNATFTGGGFCININILTRLHYLSYMSKTEDFSVYPLIGLSIFTHEVSYNDSDVDYDRLMYWAPLKQGLKIGTINLGLYARARVANFPLLFTINHKFVVDRNNDSYASSHVRKNYSSYLYVGVGLTFPIVKGPGVSKIKSIHYAK